MRTKPASTIGEIGAGVGLSATASASAVSVRACDSGPRRVGARSAIAAALEALSDGRISVLVMVGAKLEPAAFGGATAKCP